MKYIIKWHIGNCSDAGLNCLKKSISSFRKFYPEAEFHILYNQIKKKELFNLNKFDVQYHDQINYLSSFPIKPLAGYQVHWKLYPPRINKDVHEISVDNDIVIFKRIKEIDLFLDSTKHTLLYQGLNGAHGYFSEYIPRGIRINSGIFGMPPHFDFIDKMKDIKMLDNWENKFDEQGLIAYVLLKDKKYFIIPLTSIPILESNFDIVAMTNDLCCGYHFVGVNYIDNHICWKNYCKRLKFI